MRKMGDGHTTDRTMAPVTARPLVLGFVLAALVVHRGTATLLDRAAGQQPADQTRSNRCLNNLAI